MCERNRTPCSSIDHALGQAEDLKAAAVGEDRPVPAHERVQAAERRDSLLARPQREVIRVARIICAPVSRSRPASTPLTVPCVPTGMKAGVSTGPCGV